MRRIWVLAILVTGLLAGQTAIAQPAEEPPAAAEEGDKPAEGAEEGAEETEEERIAREAAEAKAKAEAEAKAKAEAEAKAKAEAERIAQEEAEAKAKAEAERKAKEEADQANIPDGELRPLKDISADVLEKVTVSKAYPYIEHGGMFRFRADTFLNLDLNTTGTSPILPPPEAFPVEEGGVIPNGDADAFAGANIRMRYSPTIHLYEDLSVHVTLDVVDNLVLGSRPDGGRLDTAPIRPDIPKLAFTGGQIPPGELQAFQLKEAFGQVRTFFGIIRAGRMSSHWGLGILANNGKCADCDFGDAADRVQFATRLPFFDEGTHKRGLYVAAAYDFPNEGPVDITETQFLGQNRDISQIDDVEQYALAIFTRPMSEEEKDTQAAILRDEGRPVINAGAYIVYRSQEASYEDFIIDEQYNGVDDLPSLEARNAEAIIPDLWVQFLWEPKLRQKLRIELEAAFILGEIEFVAAPGGDSTECFSDPNDEDCTAKKRELRQVGLAFESEFVANSFLSTGLDAGFATGRNTPGFQVNDGIVNADGSDPPSNFKFDRDYHVDMILFREIIGTVTNATYIKPWVQFDFWTRNQDTFGFRLDAIYSMAHKAKATPSGERWLGLEFDGLLFYREEGKFQADLGYGLLVPGDAFNEVPGRQRLTYPGFTSPVFLDDDQRAAEVAQTIQARMFWFF